MVGRRSCRLAVPVVSEKQSIQGKTRGPKMRSLWTCPSTLSLMSKEVDRWRELRASDADRDRVAELLGDAHADGRLTTEEHNERLDRLYAGKTHAELDPLTADLDSTESELAQHASRGLVPKEHVRPQVAILSETMARPTGRVGGRLVAVGLLGNVQIDLSHGVIDADGVVIVARAMLGAVNITVPADARVSMTGLPLLGSLSPTRVPGPADGPRVLVKALAGLGSVMIHRAEANSG